MESVTEKEDQFHQLEQLNKLIQQFIHSTLEQAETGEDQQYDLFVNDLSFHTPRLRCWEINQCMQLNCMCRTGEDFRCWLIAGTLNSGCCDGVFTQKFKTCYECEVFKQYLNTPFDELRENINILINHLVGKISMERELAIRDGLTGLYNRNFLKLIERGDLLNLNHKSFHLSVIIFDLDKLKSVNDTYGHMMGDKMIKELSEFLMTHKREPDLLFRMGGDEFMLMMSGMDVKRRRLFEERLADLIRRWNYRRKNALPVPLSFSLGGATGFWGKEINQIIMEADTAMYHHKKSKRSESTKKMDYEFN